MTPPPIGFVAGAFGQVIMQATELPPFLMGVVVSVLVGVALTLPISSAAICSVLGLTGLAGGAAVAGGCRQWGVFGAMRFQGDGRGGWGGRAGRARSANQRGVFAEGDVKGRPYQYAKAAGEGLVAAYSAHAFLQENRA